MLILGIYMVLVAFVLLVLELLLAFMLSVGPPAIYPDLSVRFGLCFPSIPGALGVLDFVVFCYADGFPIFCANV